MVVENTNLKIFKYILLIMLLQLSHFFLLFIALCPARSLPPAFPHLSSCPWDIRISSLASPFLIPFLTSPCLFCTYHSWFLFSVPFPPFSPLLLPVDNPPFDLHFCDSLPVIVVCLVCFCFLGSVVDSCEFIVTLLFIVFGPFIPLCPTSTSHQHSPTLVHVHGSYI